MAMQTSDYLIHLHDPLSHFRGLPVLLGVSASVCARNQFSTKVET